jgi:8-hydroxy-5-deazaflavin:NADPH oxidoreductase
MATQPKLRIGIIGGTLTRRLTKLGHDVAVANSRGPESLAGLAAETGATAVTVNEAARSRSIVIVTIPQKNIPELLVGLFDGAPDNLVVVRKRNGHAARINN